MIERHLLINQEQPRKEQQRRAPAMPFQGWWKEVESGWQAELHTEKRGTGNRRMWLERNLGRSTSKAARLREDGIQKENAT